MKFSITGVALFVAFSLKWCWQPKFASRSASVPPSPSHADSFPCFQAALFFSPGWWWTDATKWTLHNCVGSKGGWSSLWKWNCFHPPKTFGTTASPPEYSALGTSSSINAFNSPDKYCCPLSLCNSVTFTGSGRETTLAFAYTVRTALCSSIEISSPLSFRTRLEFLENTQRRLLLDCP